MRRLAAFFMVSLDGYFEAPDRNDFSWHNVDDEFNEFALKQLDASDALLFGRTTYQGMAEFWPTAAAIESDPEVAARMNTLPKLVFSRTLERPEPEWANTRLINDGIAQELTKLKQQPGKDLLVLASSVLTTSLIDAGVLDELRIIVNPVILGGGRALFHGEQARIRVKLTSSRQFRSGNVLLTYAV
ncbi:MAG TPA: dihydrofolate reductase family protein [Candidatus Dormibacteraeota bacterium]